MSFQEFFSENSDFWVLWNLCCSHSRSEDEVELSLASAALKTTVPRKGQTWIDATERVAAVYGPNAAGKTTLLDAMYALSTAVRTPGDRSIYQPSHSRHSDCEE